MEEHERLREVIIDLERTRAREHRLRVESESVVAGLSTLALAHDPEKMFAELLDVLQSALGFQHAFVLRPSGDGTLSPTTSTSEQFADSRWPMDELFRRVRKGRPIAIFDVGKLGEWGAQPEKVRAGVHSALYVPLHGDRRDALLICVHEQRGYFTRDHVKLGRRLGLLASQALLNMDLRAALMQRERLFALASDLLCIASYDACIQQLNAAWQRTLGYEEGELKGVSFVDALIHPEQRDEVQVALEELREGIKGSVTLELQCRSGFDEYRWFRWSITAHAEEQFLYIIAQDITESKAVAQLRQQLMNRMEEELTAAQAMQGLLLHKREVAGNCSVELIYHQATYGGGDWFYVDQLGRYLVFVIADVLGHGTPAAMLASFGRGYMIGLSSAGRLMESTGNVLQPEQILHHLNHAIFESTRGVSGMTCFTAVIDVESGDIEFSNGGHLYPIVLYAEDSGGAKRRSKRMLGCLAVPGSGVGFTDSGSFERRSAKLSHGERLIFYTDGLIECCNKEGQPYGRQPFMRLLRRLRHETATELLARVEHAVYAYMDGQPLDDDLMLAVIDFEA